MQVLSNPKQVFTGYRAALCNAYVAIERKEYDVATKFLSRAMGLANIENKAALPNIMKALNVTRRRTNA